MGSVFLIQALSNAWPQSENLYITVGALNILPSQKNKKDQTALRGENRAT